MMFCFRCALLRQRSFSQLPWYSKPGVTAKVKRQTGWKGGGGRSGVFFFFSFLLNSSFTPVASCLLWPVTTQEDTGGHTLNLQT